MQVIKKEILESISNLPDEVEIEDIMYRLYVIDKIKKGQLAVKNNEVVSTDELKLEILSLTHDLSRGLITKIKIFRTE